MNDSPLTCETRDCLVAVVTCDADLRRFIDEKWYRIPARAVGRSVAAETLREVRALALYQTSTITAGLPSAIELWGEIEEVRECTRREIIPSEAEHPAAEERYHLIRVDSVRRLERPVISRRPRRITFMRTSLERLLKASAVNDLVIGSKLEEQLWESLRDLDAERKYYMNVSDTVMEVDFALFNGDRALGVICNGDSPPASAAGHPAASDAWSVLRFSPSQLELEFHQCLDQIMTIVDEMRR